MKKFRRIILFFLAYFYPSSTLGFQREAIIWGNSSKIIFGSFTLITKKSWQIIYDEVMTKYLRWNHDKTFTKKSWKFMRWEKRWDLTSSPKHYFWVIYVHYEDVIPSKNLRFSYGISSLGFPREAIIWGNSSKSSFVWFTSNEKV